MQTLTPEQLIKKAIVKRINEQNYADFWQFVNTPEEIDAAYDLAVEKRIHWDFVEEIRQSGVETNLPAPCSRHYEVDIHAVKIDNFWLAFPFYYGGGRHGEPEAMPWMEDAFFVDCKEEQVTITQRTFTKKN